MRETARAPKSLAKREMHTDRVLSWVCCSRNTIRTPITTHRNIESRQRAIGAFPAPRVDLSDINTIQVRYICSENNFSFLLPTARMYLANDEMR